MLLWIGTQPVSAAEALSIPLKNPLGNEYGQSAVRTYTGDIQLLEEQPDFVDAALSSQLQLLETCEFFLFVGTNFVEEIICKKHCNKTGEELQWPQLTTSEC